MLRNIDKLKRAVPPIENIGKHWLNPKVLLPPQDAVSLIDSQMLATVNFDDTQADLIAEEIRPKKLRGNRPFHKRSPSKGALP